MGEAVVEGRKFRYAPPEGEPVELEVTSANGPLCVGPVFDHTKRRVVTGLYWIYLRKQGARFGPFFAELTLADRAVKKILKEFGAPMFEQPIAWLRRQSALRDWMATNVGKPQDLIGAEWSH